jgi:hypothetical protein
MRARLEPRPTSTPDGGLVRGNERRFVLVRRDLTLASFVGDGALGFTRRSRAFMGKMSAVRTIQSPGEAVPPADRCRIACPRVMPSQRVERPVRMGRLTISSLAITGFLTIGAASAAHDQQAKAIYTASQFGAYHSSFCPPIVVILESAGFHGYSCTPSGGTLDNIAKVLADPRSLGFVQLDILARWALDNIEGAKKLAVIRTLACEGLWMVTRNNDVAVVKFGQIVGTVCAA